MKSFQFPLTKALEWRKTQLEIEENKLKQMSALLEQLDLARVELKNARERAEQGILNCSCVERTDLMALAAYQRRVSKEQKGLLQKRQESEIRITGQRQTVLEARRQVRLLEKLKQRRLAEWQSQLNQEIDNLASEAYLSRWKSRLRES